MPPKSSAALRSTGAAILSPAAKPKAVAKGASGAGSRVQSSGASGRPPAGSTLRNPVSSASQRPGSSAPVGKRSSLDSRPDSAAGQRPPSSSRAVGSASSASNASASKPLECPDVRGKKSEHSAAEAVVDSIRRADITELRSLPKPPERTRKVLEVVGSFVIGSVAWADTQKMMSQSSFLADLRSISEQIRNGTFSVARLDDDRRTIEDLSTQFSNERGKLKGELALYKWATAVLADYDESIARTSGTTELAPRPNKLQRSETLGHALSGMSVHHLATELMAKIEGVGLNPDTTVVYEMEPVVIRPEGADVICPRDSKKGAAYVDCFLDPDHVGIASFMLSYSWGYRMSDIASTLECHCNDHELDPKRTYVWVCCLCINQHRVREKIAQGELVPFEEFRLAFKERVERIGNVLAMMSPWRAPLYISRVWCDFELYTATAQGIDVTICMPPQEVSDFMASLQTGNGIDEMWKVLTNVKVEKANASVPEDKESILRLIRDDIGFDKFDIAVAKYLQKWITTVSESRLKSAMQGDVELDGKAIVSLCARVGDLVLRVGQPQKAIQICEEGRRFLKKTDYDQSQWEQLFLDHIGIAKRQLGDLDGAEKAYAASKRCLEATGSAGNEIHHRDITNLGIVKMQRQDLKGALEDFEQALRLAEADPKCEQMTLGNIFLNIGNAKAQLKDLDGSLTAYAEARRMFEASENLETPTGALLMSNLANVRRMRGEFSTALEVYGIARHLFAKTGTLDTPNGATLLMNCAMVSGQTGDVKAALETAEMAKAIFEKIGMQSTPACQQAMKIIEFANLQMKEEAKSS